MGRLVHFDPFQTRAQSTQFFNSLSSGGIRSKTGGMHFGGTLASVFESGVAASLPTRVWALAVAVKSPVSTASSEFTVAVTRSGSTVPVSILPASDRNVLAGASLI